MADGNSDTAATVDTAAAAAATGAEATQAQQETPTADDGENELNELFDLQEDEEAEFETNTETTDAETPGDGADDAGKVKEGETPPPGTPDTKQTETPQAEGDAGQQTQAEPQPETPAQTSPLDSMTPEQQAQALAEFNTKAVDLLAEKVYGLGEEEVAAFVEDPGKMLPQFAGRLHMQIMQAATMNVLRMMPQVLANYNSQQSQGDQFQNAFYSENSDLNHDEHGARVLQYGQLYRQANPQASNEQFIKDVGAWVRTSYGLPALGQATQQAAQQPAPAAPQSAPYQPAGAGSMGAPVQGTSGNEFEDLYVEENL